MLADTTVRDRADGALDRIPYRHTLAGQAARVRDGGWVAGPASKPPLEGIGFAGVTFMEDDYVALLNVSTVAGSGRQDAQRAPESG